MGIKDNSEANTVISSLEFNFEARCWADGGLAEHSTPTATLHGV